MCSSCTDPVLAVAKDKDDNILYGARCKKTKDGWNYKFVLAAVYITLTLKQTSRVPLFYSFSPSEPCSGCVEADEDPT